MKKTISVPCVAVCSGLLVTLLAGVPPAGAQFGFKVPGAMCISAEPNRGETSINLGCTKEGSGTLTLRYFGVHSSSGTRRGEWEIIFANVCDGEGDCTDGSVGIVVQKRQLPRKGEPEKAWTTIVEGDQGVAYPLDEGDFEIRIRFKEPPTVWSRLVRLHVGPATE